MSEYTEQAEQFLKETGTTIKFEKTDKKANWKPSGYVYTVTIKRNRKQWTFDFTDSYSNMQNGIELTAYDVLSCITKYEVDDNLEDFVAEFGYPMSTREERESTNKTWKAVQKEYKDCIRMFDDVMEQLQEIQ
jgi:hypothetical protein